MFGLIISVVFSCAISIFALKTQNLLELVKENANLHISPCTDFYNYSCGKTNYATDFSEVEKRNNERIINYLKNVHKNSPKTIQKVKTFMETCTRDILYMDWSTFNITMKLRDSKMVKSLLKKLEKQIGVPLPLFKKDKSKFTLTPEKLGSMVGYLSGQLFVDIFFGYYIDTLHTEFVLQSPDKYKFGLTEQQILTTIQHFEKIYSNPIEIDGSLVDEIRKIVLIEKDLQTTLRTHTNKVSLYTIEEHDKEFQCIDMKNYFSNLLHFASKGTKKFVKDGNEFKFFSVNTMNSICKFLNKFYAPDAIYDPKTLINYFYIRFMLEYEMYIPEKKTRNEEFGHIAMTLPLTKSENYFFMAKREIDKSINKDHEDLCLFILKGFIPLNYAVGRILSESMYTKDERHKVIKTLQEMTDSFKVSLKKIVSNSTWISPDSKTRYLAKVDDIVPLFFGPELMHNDKALDNFYFNWPIKSVDDGALMILKLKALNKYTDFLPFDPKFAYNANADSRRKFYWYIIGQVNAYYDPNGNRLYIPISIVQDPFFSINESLVFNYAGLGSILGHEIMHGFDMNSIQRGKFGQESVQTLDAKSFDTLKSMQACLQKQYNDYLCSKLKKDNPCFKNMAEAFADVGGMTIVFHALLNHIDPQPTKRRTFTISEEKILSEEQIFFVAYGQRFCLSQPLAASGYTGFDGTHPPTQWRSFMVTKNMPEFDGIFKCKNDKNDRLEKMQCNVYEYNKAPEGFDSERTTV